MAKIDWGEHVAAFRASSQTAAEYCAATGIKPQTFRYHLYKQKTKRRRPVKTFREFPVAAELVITRGERGALSISGFDVAHLPGIVGAWSNALS